MRQRSIETQNRMDETRERIVDMLSKEHQFDRERWTVDGIPIGFSIAEDVGAHGHYRPTGRLRIVFGGIGYKKQFPEPNGGFDLPKIVAAIKEFVGYEKERRRLFDEEQVRRAKSREIADRLGKEFFGAYAEVAARVGRSGQLQVHIEHDCTEEQARAILRYAGELFGMKKSSDELPANG